VNGKRILLALSFSAAASAGGGCANPPRFVKRTPVLRLLYRPWSKPFLDHPQFSFYIKSNWKGPQSVDGGVRFSEPKGRAWVSILFLMPSMEGYREINDYRQHMREQGTVADSHVLTEMEISSRTASVARFTTFDYSPEFLLGEVVKVLYTELILVPDPAGIYLIRYEAPKDQFFRFYRVQERMLESLTLATPKEEENINPLPWLRRPGQ